MLFALEGDTIILGSKHIYALILRELLPLSSKVFHCTNIFEKLWEKMICLSNVQKYETYREMSLKKYNCFHTLLFISILHSCM